MDKDIEYNKITLVEGSRRVSEGRHRNLIPPPEKESLLIGYLKTFRDPLIIVLLVVFLFSCMVSAYEIIWHDGTIQNAFEPIGVLIALLLATGVGFIFEVKAGREFDILNQVNDSTLVKVLRRRTEDSAPEMVQIEKQDVCEGDIVCLESGDEIPADGTLLTSTQLRVDESAFTGEPYAMKSVEPDPAKESTYPQNFLLRGATIIEGNARMVVTAVGMNSEEGRGIKKVREGSDVQTPLNRQLDQLGKLISLLSFIVAAFIVVGRMVYFFAFADGGAKDAFEIFQYVLDSIMIAVTLVVVAVPEGLPMSITVSLALSMRKMLKEKNLVRKLHACETMGAATVICTDKTGTLTKNEMSLVAQSFYGDTPQELIRLSFAANSTAGLSVSDGKVTGIGNPTELALLRYLHAEGVDYKALRRGVKVMEQIPFSTENKYMETTISDKLSGRTLRLVKGAPEIVIGMCDGIAGGEDVESVKATLLSYQQSAMRTLAFAVEDITEGTPLMLLGIVGIADPVRDDVAEAIRICKDGAKVKVIIVTGDTAGTAREIGRQIGIFGDESDEGHVITGDVFRHTSDEELLALLRDYKIKVVARAKPEDKARLVTLLQSLGEVVAVTGDGTNDAPALSKAQVGLSMGDGTARAKEASDITIIDNSFASINKAILWGRSIYRNIQRFIIFQTTINICACLIVLLGSFVGLDSPLTVTQMLWVNLIMDTFAAMALSSLPADQRVMTDAPRSSKSHIFDRRMARTTLLGGMVFFVLQAGLWQLLWHTDVTSARDFLRVDNIIVFCTQFFDLSSSKSHLSTYELGLFFTFFVVMQFWNIFNARYFRTGRSLIGDIIDLFRHPETRSEHFSGTFLGIAAAIIVGQFIIVQYLGMFFNVTPITLDDWAVIIGVTSVVLIVPDVVRWVK